MSLRVMAALLISGVVTVHAASATTSTAHAAIGDNGPTGGNDEATEGAEGATGGTDHATGSIWAAGAIGGHVSFENVGSGSGSAGPVCSWELAHIESVDVDVPGGVDAGAGETASYRDAQTKEPVAASGPGVEALYWVDCPDQAGYRWIAPSEYVDRQLLIDAAYEAMYSQIPLPAPDINPPADVGSVVNLGLWLAVDDPGQVNAVAEVGPVWAATTARFTGMTWDMGNGESVTCDGMGTPYPDGSNQITQGPCGYTYTAQPPIEGYTVTATGHWEVQLVTSDGVDQMLDPIDMNLSIPYDVDEIITVGQA